MSRFQRLDVLYANAGILPIDGIDWVHGPVNLIKDPLRFFTDVSGTLKQKQGALVSFPKNTSPNNQSKSPLGLVFAANVFGHYLMVPRFLIYYFTLCFIYLDTRF